MNSYPYPPTKRGQLLLPGTIGQRKTSTTRWQDMKRRTLTALIAAPLTLAIFFLGSPFCDVLIILVASICALEAGTLFRLNGRLARALYVGLTLAVLTGAAYQWVWGWGTALALSAILFFAGKHLSTQANDTNIVYPIALAIYIGAALGFLLGIRSLPSGLAWIIVLAMNIWGTDTFALLGGRLFGRTPFAPKISPKKTWEGAISGAVVGVSVGTLVAWIAGLPVVLAFVMGLAIVTSTIIGDLVMSSIKRRQGVKDTGAILPGHGGLLDRLDGVFLSLPIAYTLMLIAGVASLLA